MPEKRRGAGVLSYDKTTRRVLLYRRDNKPTIPLPDLLDILGGHLEPGGTPEQTAVREMAEELEDRRTGAPFVLAGHRLFTVFMDSQGVLDYIFCKAADFDLADLRLQEGQELVWVTEAGVGDTPPPSATTRSWRTSFTPFGPGRPEPCGAPPAGGD